jgi:membrane protein
MAMKSRYRRLTNQILYQLQEINMVHEVVTDHLNEDIAYLPSMDTNQMSVAILLDKLDSYGSEDFKVDKDNKFVGQWKVLIEAREEYYKNAGQVLLKDL